MSGHVPGRFRHSRFLDERLEDGDPEASFLALREQWIAEGDPLWTRRCEPVSRGGVDPRSFGRDDNPGEWIEPNTDVRL